MKRTDDVIRYLSAVSRRADAGELPRAAGIFARAYHRVTLEIVARVADGFFEDPSWLSRFDVLFATLYRDALELPATRPRSWKIALEAADRGDRTLIKHLLLGINAHMRYDLCIVLTNGLVEPGRREARRRDYFAVNRVMRLAIGPIQDVLEQRYGEWLRRADAVGLGIDEFLTYERFEGWRARAWEDAMAILDGRQTRADVDARVARDARWISLIPI
jgi:hypothetical protein